MKLTKRRKELRALADLKTSGRSGLSSGVVEVSELMKLRILPSETSPMPERTLLQMRVRLILSRWLTRRRRMAMTSLTSLRS